MYLKTDLMNLDGLNVCQFCYARILSEKSIDTIYEESKTKKIDKVESNRITSNPSWSLNTDSTGNLSRIGPANDNEKYLEEVQIWKTILQSLGFDEQYSSVNDVEKLSKNPKVRILETSGGRLHILFATKKEIDLKNNERNLQQEIFPVDIPEIMNFNLQKLHHRSIEWITQSHILPETENLDNYFLAITKLPLGECFSLEKIVDNSDQIEIKELLFELGKYFYFLNFLGCSDFSQILFTKVGLSYLFINSSSNYAEKSFSDVKKALREIYVTLPLITDEENSSSFFEGVTDQKEALEKVFLSNQGVKEKIFEFFDKQQIKIDKTNALISLNSFI